MVLGGFRFEVGNDAAIRVQKFCDAGLDFRRGFMGLANGEGIVEDQVELDPMGSSGMAVTEIVIGESALFHLAV